MRKTVDTVWKVYTYDVWGDPRDGYEVNDVYSCGVVDLRLKIRRYNQGTEREFSCAEISDYQLGRVFNTRAKLYVDRCDTVCYVMRESDGFYIGELRCDSHESLSPIREKGG